MAMEYLAIEDQDLAKKGLEELRGKLRSPQQDVLERLKSQTEEFRFARAFRIAEEYTNRNLQTAGLIWDYLLERCEDSLQKIAVMNKLFRVQIATGPWNAAFETAQNLFNETTEFHLESARQKTTGGQSLGNVSNISASFALFDVTDGDSATNFWSENVEVYVSHFWFYCKQQNVFPVRSKRRSRSGVVPFKNLLVCSRNYFQYYSHLFVPKIVYVPLFPMIFCCCFLFPRSN